MFAKIVEVEGEQVLFYTEPSSRHDDRMKLHQIVELGDIQADVVVDGLTEEAAEIALGGAEEAAPRLRKIVQKMLDGEI